MQECGCFALTLNDLSLETYSLSYNNHTTVVFLMKTDWSCKNISTNGAN